jgi:hypothetical protein
MKEKVAPRIFCIPATKAPIVAVFRRGPTHWSHVGRWDLGERRYELGAWLRGRIFPRRSDLSPDGRFLCCFAHNPGAAWEHGSMGPAMVRVWHAAQRTHRSRPPPASDPPRSACASGGGGLRRAFGVMNIRFRASRGGKGELS